MRVYILLDGSGSMATRWDDTLGSINTYVKTIGDAPLTREAAVTVSVFKTGWNGGHPGVSYETLREGEKAAQWRPLTREDAIPTGGTPLYDAIARLDEQVENDQGPGVLVIVTDGQENASVRVNKDGAKLRLDKYRAREWGVVFLGADFDAFSEAGAVGVSVSNTLNTSGAEGFKKGMEATARKTVAYAAAAMSGIRGQSLADTMVYNDEDREEAKK